jgi:GNAT superfamily N-acetyltransferase
MTSREGLVTIRGIERADYEQWRPLWDGYNAFYGRSGPTALPDEITLKTWDRFFDAAEPVHALVAEDSGPGDRAYTLSLPPKHYATARRLLSAGLFTAEEMRGRGIGRQLIEAVYEAARKAGSSRVYWQTQATNQAGRALYDKVARHLGFIVYSHEL